MGAWGQAMGTVPHPGDTPPCMAQIGSHPLAIYGEGAGKEGILHWFPIYMCMVMGSGWAEAGIPRQQVPFWAGVAYTHPKSPLIAASARLSSTEALLFDLGDANSLSLSEVTTKRHQKHGLVPTWGCP